MTESSLKFSFETTKELPKRSGGTGQTKYDWSSFPAPKADGTMVKAYIEIASPSGIYKSLTQYKKGLTKSGTADKDLPDFTVSRVRDENTKKNVGVWVQRTK